VSGWYFVVSLMGRVQGVTLVFSGCCLKLEWLTRIRTRVAARSLGQHEAYPNSSLGVSLPDGGQGTGEAVRPAKLLFLPVYWFACGKGFGVPIASSVFAGAVASAPGSFARTQRNCSGKGLLGLPGLVRGHHPGSPPRRCTLAANQEN